MRKQGGRPAPLTDDERKFVKEFLENDLSYEEMAKKVGLTKAQLRYRVAKYRKETDNNGAENSKRG